MRSRSPATLRQSALAFAVLLLGAILPTAAQQSASTLSLQPKPNPSVRHEVERAIDKGLSWLEKNQDTNGFWSSPEYPAITALDLAAYQLRPNRSRTATETPAVRRGYAYLLRCVQPDGGIYRKELPSYNTSIALMAFTLAHRQEYLPVILNARKFIAGLQVDLDQPGKADNPFDGGIGYGGQEKRPDLSNTSFALEALAMSKDVVKDKPGAEADLNWAAAIHFIQSCQNLPQYNKESWASDDPQNKGGFIYSPGHSMAGETNLPSGRVALRSFGSMSYAGLLSYIYADLKHDDPRVAAVMDWLRANYSVDENPALGAQGLYYYYHTMAKALTLYGAGTLELGDGRNVDWREQLALKLINLQRTDGSWSNDNGRWFEKDPALVTAYAVIALDLIGGKM